MKTAGLILLALLLTGVAVAQQSQQHPITQRQRENAGIMLSVIQDTLLHHYYDPTFHGINIKADYEKYREELKTAPTLGDAFRIIAAYLASLGDSHTFFIPPPRSYDTYYGFRMQMIGEHCFITAVRPGLDAAAKVHPGDEIVHLNGFNVNRKDFFDLSYDLNVLQPQGGLRLDLLDPQGQRRQELVRTKFVVNSRIGNGLDFWQPLMDAEAAAKQMQQQYFVSGDVFIWKLPIFEEDESDLSSIYGKARKHGAIVLDLRGNPGGLVDELKFLLADFVHEETPIAAKVGRKHSDPDKVKPRGDAYTGKLFVLVDSNSASAAELFARIVQLEHLGTVVGDHSAGAVMEAQFFPFQMGVDLVTFYGASITADDLIMADGNSLEKTGVTPDVEITPTAADMATGRDPVLAKAVALGGGTITPEAAGKLFPFVWPPFANSH